MRIRKPVSGAAFPVNSKNPTDYGLWDLFLFFPGCHLDFDGKPFFNLHFSGLMVHHVRNIRQNVSPFFSRVPFGVREHQIGTGIQLPFAEGPGIGIDYAQSQGIGGIIEIVVRVVPQEPGNIFLGQPLYVAPQTQNKTCIVTAQFTAPSAIGRKVAIGPLTEDTAQRNPDLSAEQTQENPQQDTDKTE